MDITETISYLAQFVKPGSAILGLVIVVKFLHTVIDSNRVYKIKQLELLHNCMKEADSGGKAYTIEKLLENTYKVHIPYEQAMVMMDHRLRHKLLGWYKASHRYLDFGKKQFTLLPKFSSRRAFLLEKYRVQIVIAGKYYFSALSGSAIFIIGYEKFMVSGLDKIQFGTYNFVWFAMCVVISALLAIVAFGSLSDQTSIAKAKQFAEAFESINQKKSPVWMY